MIQELDSLAETAARKQREATRARAIELAQGCLPQNTHTSDIIARANAYLEFIEGPAPRKTRKKR